MSAENLKGCRPCAGAHTRVRAGVVDHSTKSSGGGSQDPIPLKSVSAGKSHVDQGVGPADSLPPTRGLKPVRLFSISDVAKYLSLSRMQVYRWMKKLPLKSHRFLRERPWYMSDEVEAWYELYEKSNKVWTKHYHNKNKRARDKV